MIYIGKVFGDRPFKAVSRYSYFRAICTAGLVGWQAGSRVSFGDCTINKKDFNNYIKPAYINYWQNQL